MLFLRKAAAVMCAALLLFAAAPARADEGVLDLLLIGVDTPRADQRGRSDVMMLARVDAQRGQIRLVSFLRDLYVAIPGHGKTRLNAAYYYGGEALLKKTLEKNFGLSVDRTVTVHYRMLSQLIDEIGGIEVDVTEEERKHLNKLLLDYGPNVQRLESAGLQRLNGQQALCFSRIRKLDSDFGRTSRQQTVLQAMLGQISTMSKWQLMRLALKYMEQVKTDVGFGDLAALVPLAARLDELDIRTAHVPFEGAFTEETINGMMVLVPNLQRCRSKLDAFLTAE